MFGFERSMNKVSALSNAGAKDMLRLRDAAKDYGVTTQFSASAVADAMGELALAGFKTNKILISIPGTLDLAAASGLELGEAAKTAAKILGGFNFEAKEMNRVNDVLAKTSTSSLTSIKELSRAMTEAGPTAHSAGISYEETSAILGAFADAGIAGAKAGTNLGIAITRLLKPSREVRRVLRRLKINPRAMLDSQGKIKDFTGVIEKLRDAGVTTAQTMEIFGEEAGRRMVVLLQKGSRDIRKLTAKLQNSAGAAEEMAKRMNAGIVGATRSMVSAFEAVQISVGESGLTGEFIKLFKAITEGLRAFNKLDAGTRKFIGTAIVAVAVLAPLLTILGFMAAGLAVLLSPIGLLVVAVATFSAGLAFLATKSEGVRDALSEMADVFSPIMDSLSELGKAFAAAVGIPKDFELPFKNFSDFAIAAIDKVAAALRILLAPLKAAIDITTTLLEGGGIEGIKKSLAGASENVISGVKSLFGFGETSEEAKARRALKRFKESAEFSSIQQRQRQFLESGQARQPVPAGAAIARQQALNARMDGEITVRATPGSEVKKTESRLTGTRGNLGINIAGAVAGS
ncbi:MAG: phage tail tape measure protein [Gammaproteobacteria bacterium]